MSRLIREGNEESLFENTEKTSVPSVVSYFFPLFHKTFYINDILIHTKGLDMILKTLYQPLMRKSSPEKDSHRQTQNLELATDLHR